MTRFLEVTLGVVIIVCALWIYVTWVAVAYTNWINERRGGRK